MKKLWLVLALAAGFGFAACSSDKDDNGNGNGNGPSEWVEDDPDDYLDGATFPLKVEIVYDGESATVTAAAGIRVTKQGAHVVVDAAADAVEGMEIVLRGGSEDGSLKVYSLKKYKLTLDGVALASRHGAAINNQSKKRTFVYLGPGSVNSLEDAAAYDDLVSGEDSKGCLFSEGQLVFSGSGSLSVRSQAKHGIVSDEYVRVFGGSFVIRAGKDALHANDYIRIEGGELNLTPASDGIECERGFVHLTGGSVSIECGADGVKASGKMVGDHDPYVRISGGKLTVVATGEKAKGIEAVQDIVVEGGEVTLHVSGAAGKCVKAGRNVRIDGGSLSLTAEGGGVYEAGDTSAAACIRADNGVTVTAGAVTCRATGEGGKGINCMDLTVGAGARMEIAAEGGAFQSGGLKSSPKGIKAEGSVKVSGRLGVWSREDDALSAGGSLTIDGGCVIAAAGREAKAFDCPTAAFAITGGVVVATGGDTDLPSASASRQRSVVCRELTTAGGLIHVATTDGTPVLTYQTPRALARESCLFSTPVLADGEYVLMTGGQIAGGEQWYGYYTAGTYSGGTRERTFTISSMVTPAGR